MQQVTGFLPKYKTFEGTYSTQQLNGTVLLYTSNLVIHGENKYIEWEYKMKG